ncbi:DUF1656 domain-containing protein [Vibrio mediterranei]|jgi:uncharacterized membrane protein|uniref:DUF1656 domain-containing protein n=1 Tax=Vibrio mediterranei TaxID=689 RepID=UPI0007867060|nr:DUF1656 domain-containing protein [Vibrio mediterranei]MCG9658295.1 DUF1656 domain-containing protein [Vibrio mediterranei]MCG9664929.1 DUF1656 domain-containing protein [Vibrio mediterranei]PTC04564.1 DUF1656 domain-containing protein [Vibrio mediterranei]SBO11375.1 hypothetical protein VME0621_03511 [Vibrio mediterranei]
MPHEMSWGDIYFSPLVLVLILALIATWITVVMLNKVKLSRFIAFPSPTFLAILVLYVIAIDHFYLRF